MIELENDCFFTLGELIDLGHSLNKVLKPCSERAVGTQ